MRQVCAAPEFVCIADNTLCSKGEFCAGDPVGAEDEAPEDTPAVLRLNTVPGVVGSEVGWCRLTVSKPVSKCLWFQGLR